MKLIRNTVLGLLSLCLVTVGATHVLSQAETGSQLRAKAQKLQQQGNFKEAYQGFRKLCLAADTDAKRVGDDLARAGMCLQRLGRVNELDELLESTVKVHAKNWRLLRAAADQYTNIPHHGYLIAGEYRRGHHRGGGKMVNSLEKDRVRALQLMVQAMPLANQDDSKGEVASFYQRLASQLLNNRGYSEAWRLQYLAKLDELPDLDDGYPRYRQYNGAPVDEDGKPVFFATAKSWDTAKTDGERWRWALDQAVENDPSQLNTVRWQIATFARSLWGVQSMNYGRWGHRLFGQPTPDDDKKDESGTFALDSLKENETIAKLATGVKRFELPDEYNFIKLFQQIAAEPKTGNAETAVNALAEVFENRRQYPKAADYWQQSIEQFGAGNNNWKPKRRSQIVSNWGTFEQVSTQPSGEGASVEFRFRNAKHVAFTAQKIKVDQLLADVKEYLKSDPRRLDYQKVNIGNIGYRLVQNNETKYIGQQVAQWDLDLQPRDKHYDRRITITTPLQEPGAYLVTGKVRDGNVTRILLWVSDTAIVRKQLNGKSLYFVADAVSGKPIDGLNVEFFGYRRERLANRQIRITTANFAETTDASGQIMPDPRDLDPKFTWVAVARGKDRLAYLGFSGVWSGRYYDAQYNQTKIFAITDRPVYRPSHKVQYKFWIRHAQYDKDDVSQFAGISCPLDIYDPKNQKIHSETLTADEFGGVTGTYELPEDATLGVYRFQIRAVEQNRNRAVGGGTFRVEEYKKPEFEVAIDAPTEPVMLGERIKAKVTARYYFGSPVTNATVKFKVLRQNYNQNWYPVGHWDWCYGPGYWWFGYDAPWYPGWRDWVGCVRPGPFWWFPVHRDPPEVVAEQEVELGENGTLDIEIDTALAKAVHANSDHEYTITAEVRDESRRTIVGQGKVLVARKPFKVFSWVNRGYYRVGDTVGAEFMAQTLDKKPVQGEGVLTLLKITYDKDGKPIETPVRRWNVATDAAGRAVQQMRASAKGQYRLSYKLTDSKEHEVEGGYLFTIIGEGFDGKDYRFNNIELIPEKREYAPGEKVKLQINTDRADSTVLLFVRPANGVYLPPEVLRMQGKSAVHEIDVIKKDMPNFYVEAVTVSGGRVYSDSKEIVVPPEKRVLNVTVVPSETTYKPGQKAKVKVHLTDHTGENFTGSTVVAIYDKALEYISGGSNVTDIKEFFWKWRRQHRPNEQTNLARWFGNLLRRGETGMANIGVFGATVAEDFDGRDVEGQADAGQKGGALRKMAKSQAMPAAPAAGGFGGGGGRAGGFANRGLAAAAEMANGIAFDQSAPADKSGGEAGPGGDAVEPTVRSKFADTALWVGALTTAKDGTAEVELTMPENLTTWKVKVWAMGHGTKVGQADAEVVTRKNVILRLQAPRFFVQKDEVVLSANVHNYLASDKQVNVVLELPGDELQIVGNPTVTVNVPANGEQRVDWRVKVAREGQVTVRMKALTDEESDAMEVKLPVYVHGMLKTESWAGTIRPDGQNAKVTINVPAERRPDQSVLEVRYSPSLATAMVDALPYLADFPYGCTEQTLNRFLPSVITQKVLRELNVNLDEVRDKRTNLNAQEVGDDRERAKQWKRFKRNAVFDPNELDRMVKDGLKALTNMQNSDGGWGWFSGSRERSWPHTTAVVVHGLQVAKENDVAMVPGVLENGIKWLERYQAGQLQRLKNAKGMVNPWKRHADNLDAFTYMVLVDAGIDNAEMRDFLYRDRVELAVYAKAMYGLALHKQNQQEKLEMIMRNIDQFMVQDEENETAYLKLPENNPWWYWYGSETEANAYYLKLLARTGDKSPVSPRLVKYLLNNRKHATYWSNTRDTAICVESFAEYIRLSGEMQPDMLVEVWVDGQKRKEVQITAGNLFTYDNKFLLTGEELTDGSHEVELRRKGKGPVYFNAYLTNFTLEDHITRAGLEVKVNRQFYKLTPVDKEIKVEGARGQAVDQKVEKYKRSELSNLDTLKSGDLVEIELVIESKNDYEYLIFEDMKAAGFEPVDVRSGYTNNGLGAYMELRDNRVSFFVRRLARGKHSISYRMRAEIPGQFSALPTRAFAMYAPELKGNSDEIKLKIED